MTAELLEAFFTIVLVRHFGDVIYTLARFHLPNAVLTFRRFYLLVVMDARKQRRTRKRYTTKSRLDSMAVTDVRSVHVGCEVPREGVLLEPYVYLYFRKTVHLQVLSVSREERVLDWRRRQL